MKNKFLLKNSYIFLILISSICFGQNKSEVLINNIKNEEDIRKEGLVWYDSNNVMKANFKENYKSLKFTNPKDLAFEYLNEKYKVLGLNKELEGLELISSLKSDNRENFYFVQSFNDIPIFGTEIIITIDSTNTVTYVLNNCKNMDYIHSIRSDEIIGKQEAFEIVLNNLRYNNNEIEHIISKTYVELENEELVLCWKLHFDNWTFLISTVDGKIYKKAKSVLEADIQTKVFAVNPLYTAEVSYGTTGYTDNYDATTAQLNAELAGVTLDDVHFCTVHSQNGYSNDYCNIIDVDAPNTNYGNFYQTYPLSNSDNWYANMDRGDDMFEVAMVLYHIDKAGDWVVSLGYSVDKVDVDPHGSNQDGAWADLAEAGAYADQIRFGVGGVDLAEDQTVIWHEYAHHVNYSLHPTQNYFYDHLREIPTASLLEGFSDYFAASYKNTINGWDPAALAEWGLAEYYENNPLKKRRVDTDNTYPDDYGSDYHLNGQIFSSALMDVENEIGRFKSNKILLSSIAQWGNSPSMASAGENFVSAADNLYDDDDLCDCIINFKAHGLTQSSYPQYYVEDETIQSSIIYNDVCAVTFEDVIIDNSPNINVVVDPKSGETTIVKSFEVKLGSTLEIK